MARLIRTEKEVEGRFEEVWIVVEEDPLEQWPAGPLAVVGRPAPRKDGPGTWISDDIIAGYSGLHRMGHAHSSEVWLDGELVGGAYGVCIGRMFYGESMFARVTDASKVALAYLVAFLRAQGVRLLDCQQETGHLASLGAFPVARRDFLEHLRKAIEEPPITRWEVTSPLIT